MINVFISGHIGRDAEAREINGKTYNVFSVASTRQGVTTWVECLKADAEQKLTRYIRKGGAIAVSGTINVSAFTNKEGGANYKITCWVNDLQLLSRAEQAAEPNTAAPQPKPAAAPPRFPTNTTQMNALRQQMASAPEATVNTDGDLPF